VILIRVFWLAAILICFCGAVAAQVPPLAIATDSLPALSAGVDFHILLRATGGVPPYVWSVASGDLPEGVTLDALGCLCGRPTKPGTFTFASKVEDSGHPAHAITRDFHGTVSASLLLEWLDPPKVHDNRIDGSVQVSNDTKDAFDLTVVIVAVAVADQRATAIGYEHFQLDPGATNVPINFGNTLPHGAYVIHADAIAEIPAKKNILRERLQTEAPLQIAAGP
jgi:Putative Ig domain